MLLGKTLSLKLESGGAVTLVKLTAVGTELTGTVGGLVGTAVDVGGKEIS